MGLFGFGKKSISDKEIDKIVFAHLQELGSPKDIGKKAHIEKFVVMLNELDQWAVNNGFGDWKRAAISGSIEGSLRRTYKGYDVGTLVSDYLKMVNTIIMKLS